MQSSDSDFIWGAEKIGAVLGRNKRSVFHLLETGAIKSARKVRGLWVVSRSALLKEFGADDGVA
jgi:hypothetical protein